MQPGHDARSRITGLLSCRKRLRYVVIPDRYVSARMVCQIDVILAILQSIFQCVGRKASGIHSAGSEGHVEDGCLDTWIIRGSNDRGAARMANAPDGDPCRIYRWYQASQVGDSIVVVFRLLEGVRLLKRGAFTGAPSPVVIDQRRYASCLETFCRLVDVAFFEQCKLVAESACVAKSEGLGTNPLCQDDRRCIFGHNRKVVTAQNDPIIGTELHTKL
jgi:hypothetical protein